MKKKLKLINSQMVISNFRKIKVQVVLSLKAEVLYNNNKTGYYQGSIS